MNRRTVGAREGPAVLQTHVTHCGQMYTDIVAAD